MKAVIVGGGIGGLAAALALHRTGVDVVVLERTPGPTTGGAALSLWPNALRALDVLGVGTAVREHAALGGDSGVRTPDGRWLARTQLGAAITAQFGDPLVLIPRRRLTDLLRAHLPDGTVRYDQHVQSVTSGTESAPATIATSISTSAFHADLVVGADGARSRLRSHLFPSAPGPCYAGYTAWRMIASAPAELESFETWGSHGRRFAVLPLSDTNCYCYATLTTPQNTALADELDELRRLFGDWHHPIPEILESLTSDEVLRTDITDLASLPTLHRGRVALLGDAAHAMTPELGQGACLALEDAVVLAATIDPTRTADIPAALERYTGARQQRTTSIARRSARAAGLHHRATWVRYTAARAMNLAPSRLIAKGLRPVVDWTPPDSAHGAEHAPLE